MPDYGKDRSDTLTRQAIEYWGREFYRLRIGPQLGISFDTFLRLKRSVRHNVHTWAHTQLRNWRQNPRWMPMTSTPWILGFQTDDPADAEATYEPGIADHANAKWINPN